MNRTILPDPNIPAPQQYKKLECVGRGAYGSVHKGVFIPTGEVVALKIINLDGQDDDVDAIQKEVALLSSLSGGDNINITRYHGCWLEGPHVWIVMDFAQGGSVRTLAKAAPNNSIEERFTPVIMREVLQGLAFLHRNNVIHRDLKAANVLISSDGRVMLCDFGVSALLATPHSKRSTFVGTPQWMAPEVILGQTYDTKADIWGLGITLYEMVTGAPPHADQDHMRALMLIPKLKPPKLPDTTDASKEMRDFLALCLQMSPGDRLSAEELMKSKWIKSAKASVGILKDLLTRYESWSSKGGVRASLTSPFGALDPDEEPEDFSQPQSWQFETITHIPEMLLFLILLARFECYLRMPPILAWIPFVSIHLDLVRPCLQPPARAQLAHISIDLASPDPERDGTPTIPDSARGILSVRRDSTDILTARQANYVFPRPNNAGLDTARPIKQDPALSGTESDSSNAPSIIGRKLHKPSFSGSMGLPRSPRPPAPQSGAESDAGSTTISNKSSVVGLGRSSENGATMSPPRVPSYREVRDSKGLANISIPPSIGTGVGVVQSLGSPEIGDGERAQEKASSDKPRGKDTESLHGQGSGSGSSLPSTSGINGTSSRPNRERPPRAKRNATVGSPTDFRFGGAPPDGGLVPPSVGSSHGMSRSLDSRAGGGVNGFGNGFGGGGSFGGSGSFGGINGNGAQLPRPPLLGRQASAMAVLEGAGKNALSVPSRSATGASPVAGGTVLKDLLKLSPAPVGALRPGTNTDILPPSPGVGPVSLSPVSRVFNPSPSGLHTSTTPTDISMGTGSNSPVNGTQGLRVHTGGHSQSNSYSSAMHAHSHFSNRLHPDVPDLAPLDLGALVSTDDVHAELSRTVDGLIAWLGVVDTGLADVLGSGELNGEFTGDERSESGSRFDRDEENVTSVGA
ncbi:STE/STE11 kinase [Ceratobasidium sp. AG-Ba]|nr:STE/STE11 kinase [Ceratobasidium sp. AG-Ba]